MPVYTYHCGVCEHRFDLHLPVEKRNQKQYCPKHKNRQPTAQRTEIITADFGWKFGQGGILKGFGLPLDQPGTFAGKGTNTRKVFGPGKPPKTGGVY